MSHPSQDARPSARRRRAIEPIRWLREYTRHHGVWTPGVKLMRNHDLKTKAAICLGLGLVVLGLPLQESIRERWHTWRHMQIAQAGLAQTIEMGKLGWSLGDLSEALLNEPLGRPVPPLEPILAKESSSYAQLMRLTEGPDAPGPTKRAAAGLTDTRSAFLNRLNEAASTPISFVFRNGLKVIELRSPWVPSALVYARRSRCSSRRERPRPSLTTSRPAYFQRLETYRHLLMSISLSSTPAIAGPMPRTSDSHSL